MINDRATNITLEDIEQKLCLMKMYFKAGNDQTEE